MGVGGVRRLGTPSSTWPSDDVEREDLQLPRLTPAGAVVGGLTSAAYGALRPPKPTGAAAIISMLPR